MNTQYMNQQPQRWQKRWQIIGMLLVSALIALSLLGVRSTMAQNNDVPATEQPCPPEDSSCEVPPPGDAEPPLCPPEDPTCDEEPRDCHDDDSDTDCAWPMQESGTISGTVTNDDGEPLPFIGVEAYEKMTFDDGEEEWVEARWTKTKEDGTYSLNDLPAGTYRIGYFVWGRTMEYYNDQPDLADAEDIVVANSEVVPNINASIELPEECEPVPPECDEDGNCKPVEPCEPLWDDDWDDCEKDWDDCNKDWDDKRDDNWDDDWSDEWDDDCDPGRDDDCRSDDILPPFCYPPEDAPLDWKPPEECWHDWQDMPECEQPADDPEWVAPPHCERTERDMGYITGTVTEPNGEPIAYASVEAFQRFGIDCEDVDGNSVTCKKGEWMPMGWAETNEKGFYKMHLMPGTYRIKFTEWSWTYPEEYYDDQPTLESSTVVTVTAKEITPNINASFNEPRRSITGTVTDPEGEPLEMVFIEAFLQGNTDGDHTEWIPSGWTETKEDGTYSLNNLPAGTYRLRFEDMDWNYAPEFYADQRDIEQAQDILVTDDATTTDINVSLDPPQPSITGRVTNPEGEPVAFTMVSAFRAFDPYDKRMYPIATDDSTSEDQAMEDMPPEWFPVAWAETDEDGTYSLNDLPAGTYRIEFAHWEYRITYYDGQTRLENAQEVTVLEDAITTDINATLIPPKPSITGTVTDINGEPLAFVGVSAFEKITFEERAEERAEDEVEMEEWMPMAWAETDEDGTYSLNDLPAGTYRVELAYWGWEHAEFYDGQQNIEQAQDIVVAEGETITNINASLDVENMPPPWFETDEGNTIVDPTTGEIIYNLWNGIEKDIPFTTTVTCENGATPEDVMLTLQPLEIDMAWDDMGDNGAREDMDDMAIEPIEIPMQTTDISGTYKAIIPVEHIIPGDLHVTYACSGSASNDKNDKRAGAIQLHDPSGQITDAETGAPIKGAHVELFKVEGWQPKESANDDSPNTCHTNATKGDRAWSDLPAASPNLGTQADPATGQISPEQNPLFTDAEGKYGWEVARGCWYVAVEADGYEPITSPIVGVPNAVTDLNLTLQPLAQTLESTNNIFLPMVMR